MQLGEGAGCFAAGRFLTGGMCKQKPISFFLGCPVSDSNPSGAAGFLREEALDVRRNVNGLLPLPL